MLNISNIIYELLISKIMWWGSEREYDQERFVHQWCPRQKQVETMLQKSDRPRLTGKILPSRRNGEEVSIFLKTGQKCWR